MMSEDGNLLKGIVKTDKSSQVYLSQRQWEMAQ